jgi:hypothetical protein
MLRELDSHFHQCLSMLCGLKDISRNQPNYSFQQPFSKLINEYSVCILSFRFFVTQCCWKERMMYVDWLTFEFHWVQWSNPHNGMFL